MIDGVQLGADFLDGRGVDHVPALPLIDIVLFGDRNGLPRARRNAVAFSANALTERALAIQQSGRCIAQWLRDNVPSGGSYMPQTR